jgi:DNA polymerase-3 subunit epsilon
MTNLALVFDVETTGLIPKNEPDLEKCPYIIQLSFIVYNFDTKKIDITYNAYINIPKNIRISQEIERLTGATHAKCVNGVLITDALSALYEQYIRCNTVIAHNIEFDSNMIRIELSRNERYIKRYNRELFNLLSIGFEKSNNITRYCTMANSVDLCNIIVSAKDKRGIPYTYKKYPKLSELHEKLFASIPENLHDSLIDTNVCLKCYLQLVM